VESLFFLIPVALVFCAVAIRLLLWAIDSGQYDDLDKEGWRVLADDDPPAERGQTPDDTAGADDGSADDDDGGARR
jgi:cbb3-type cytochrome oxidase maturation protein